MAKEAKRATHGFGPVYDGASEILILGSFPSVKSREQAFYYGHPQNRFWRVLAALAEEGTGQSRGAGLLAESLSDASVEEKERFLHEHHIALYDVIESCRIIGSSDASISDVEPADLSGILAHSRIGDRIYTNGAKAYTLYQKYIYPASGIAAVKLPSTSPANAAWSLERLTQEWRRLIGPL